MLKPWLLLVLVCSPRGLFPCLVGPFSDLRKLSFRRANRCLWEDDESASLLSQRRTLNTEDNVG